MRCRCFVLAGLLWVGLAVGAEKVSISLAVHEQPVEEVLRSIARAAQLELEVGGTLPARKVSLELRAATLEAALGQVLRPLGFAFVVEEKKIVVRPAGDASSVPPAPEGVPAALVARGRSLLEAVVDAGDDRAARALGAWLRAQRPDWRRKLAELLPDLWLARDASPAAAMRGAHSLAFLGEPDGARRLLAQARRDPALEYEARCLAAELELARGNAARAVAEASVAARLKPGGDWAAALLAEAQLYQGREQEALAEAMAAEARWPRSVPVLATLGNILRRQQAAAGEADRYLQGALEIQPGQPDALYGLAILTALDDRTERSQWLAMLRAEPFSIRADRVRLGVAALESVRLSERGGPLWDLSRDGQRLLYYMQFRKQLEITDVGGFGLANQVTDQDSEKVAASLSPDEQYLAWVVADQRGDQLYVQGTNASGSHELVLQGTRGAAIRRTTWSPDSHLLLFTEVVDNAKARSVRLRCWDHQARREVEPPERLRLAGFGDAVWTAAGDVIGTVTDGGQQALVAVAANGEVFVLRPAARLRAYTLPAADATLSRVVYQAADLTAAPTDGSEGGEVPVMTGASSSTGALWTPDGSRLLVSVGDTVPTSVTMGGLADGHQVLARMEPLLAVGPRPTRLELRLRHRHGPRLSGHIRATTVLDDGTDGWTQTVKVNLTIGGEATASFAPPDATPGVHWLRVEVTLNDTADPPRWYRSEVVP